MKIIPQPIQQPAPNQILLPLLFDGVPADKASKIVNLGTVIQAAAADGKFTLTEDMMIGMAFALIFLKES